MRKKRRHFVPLEVCVILVRKRSGRGGFKLSVVGLHQGRVNCNFGGSQGRSSNEFKVGCAVDERKASRR
jgi:hypothetical protein